MVWLKSRSLGEEVEPLRDIVRRQVFNNFFVRIGVMFLGVPLEGVASSHVHKSLSLQGFANRDAEDLICQGLATLDAGSGIVPMPAKQHWAEDILLFDGVSG